ncbi:ABC transporter ATP-binding protein [Flavobacterium sp.]|uniref:ABC transporter ATP-binding protein n=1 Tax=Flavobacterium sp. TaxID=239 RepID=UPI0025DB7C75|nr:ABC transporter ATP-binding protein [Flavobacterium sp.]
MSKPSIHVENLSKAYQIGQIGTGTISRDIERFWLTKILGKEDPFLKIGQTNDRSVKGESDIVWSLKDINFEIKQGEAVGIIGKNGAGKSTLLKLLSRVTSPTMGEIKVKGRISSLLEVGTGFHPELSGRENIYLNGTILGMRKKEITQKLDEIIDFSGVERYIDTPVKRYSSGMYVRLAFAVAAHLESEILIVDEVLAVGDAEFQKKCLGKMGDISKGEGRTILFVSHNMAAVKSLCQRGIVLENGILKFDGTTNQALTVYDDAINLNVSMKYIGEKIIKKAILNEENDCVKYKSLFKLDVYFESKEVIKNVVLGIVIKDFNNVELIGINNKHYIFDKINPHDVLKGKVSLTINEIILLPGLYKIDIFLGDSTNDIEVLNDAIIFNIQESFQNEILNSLDFRLNKVFHENVDWEFNKI